MKDIIILILLTALVLYIFQLTENKDDEENKFKKYFNQSKIYIFIVCMIILTYNLKNIGNSSVSTSIKNIPEVYTENFKF